MEDWNGIALGNEVKDKVTGFTGIATSRIEYLNGCKQICIKPKMVKDSKMPDGEYIDIQQIEVVGEGVDVAQKPTGGDMMDSPKG